MRPQQPQLYIINKYFPKVTADDVKIIAEAGSVISPTEFNGSFIAKIGRSFYRFDDNKMTKKVK